MSWDIFVQELPQNIKNVKEIPDDYKPKNLALDRDKVIAAIKEVASDANFDNPSFGTLDRNGFTIDFNLSNEKKINGFVMHVRGASAEAIIVIQKILDKLNLRALDSVSESGLFSKEESLKSFERWQKYRNYVVES